MEKIHVALAVCDPKGNYTQHAGVTIASVFANTKSPVCAHILHDETLTDENRTKLKELAENFGQEIEFINAAGYIDKRMKSIGNFPSVSSKGMLFRLLLPDLSQENKMLYLDCDIVATLDIAELWNTDLQDKSIAAVPDVCSLDYIENRRKWPKFYGKLWDAIGIKRGEYFNSGVLLMNLKKLREEKDFLLHVEQFLSKYKNCLFFADQDCLNSLFSEDKILLDEKFNRIRWHDTNNPKEIKTIWHYAHHKPWEYYERPGIDELYWIYFRQTPWGRDENALITEMLQSLSSSKYVHLHSSTCVEKLRNKLAENIFNGHVWISFKLFLSKFL